MSITLGLFAVTSCQDNRQTDGNSVDLENYENSGTTEDNAMEQERLERSDSSISSRIGENQDLSTFSQEMIRAELDDDFRQGEGPYTIFAPSNVAYDELSQEGENQFENIDAERAGASMHYLVINDELTSEELKKEIQEANGSYTMKTMQGEELTATLDGETLVLQDASGNTATITEADMDASNGTVHVINRLLRPSDNTQSEAKNQNWNPRNDQLNYEEGDINNNETNAANNRDSSSTSDY
ncbi:hypothetical protein GCM10007103_29540 [Salinimicrobium marinum]|uniref:FAS1 domain-containing protein n=2 Tax=Salinimicrobium marinum TaxID=680283 RepID=A0A918SJ05_9FLAO|nr:hypothetical protein GCM10007103_29540 [Salinimicrobium marinum]